MHFKLEPSITDIIQHTFGYVGLFLWSVQLIPQVIYNYRRKSCAGLSPYMMAMWYSGSVMFVAYIIHTKFPLPIILQPTSFGLSTIVCLFQYLVYETKLSTIKLAITCAFTALVSAACFAAFYYIPLMGLESAINWPLLMLGLVPAMLLTVAYLMQFYEIYRTRNPFGLDMTFLLVDMLGAVCFVVSVALQRPFNCIALYQYSSAFIFDVVLCVWCAELKRTNTSNNNNTSSSKSLATL